MRGQAPAWLAAYIGVFVEGFLEPIPVAIVSSVLLATSSALGSSTLNSPSSELILQYMTVIFLITIALIL